jgi:hypothetical protein
MIHTARTQNLLIIHRKPEGYLLGDDEGSTVLLPANERLTDRNADGTVRVFVYRDHTGKLLATLKMPKAEEGGSATMRVFSTGRDEALVDWGLDQPLSVPHRHQRKPLEEGRWYVVHVAVDPENDRPYGSTRYEDFLDNTDLSVNEGDRVELVVLDHSALGFSVSVNERHQGLIHASDVFKPLSIGDRITGFVRQVRPDSKLDITLQAMGYRQYNTPNVELLTKRLQAKGFLALTDKSSAEDIYREFGISKKAFKQALGALYKERKVRLEEHGVVWVGQVIN